MSDAVLVISPVRNEAAHLARVLDAMAAQTRPPEHWVVVDDRSDDGTYEMLLEREREIPFLRVLQAPDQGIPAGADRLRAAADAVAFNWALGRMREEGVEFGYIGKLDGDIELDPAHFERLLAELRADPRLGLVGCYLEYEKDGGLVLQEMPDYHVPGPVKLYRRDCFAQIGGMPELLGWDTADEVALRLRGWSARSLRDLRARHLKPPGSVGGYVAGKVRHGECVWIVNYPASTVLARGLRLVRERPYGVVGLAYVFGYFRARLRRDPQWPVDEVREAAREEQRRRFRSELRARFGRGQ